LIIAISSNDETIDHFENLFETGSLTDKELYQSIHNRLEILGKIKSIYPGNRKSNNNDRASSNQTPETSICFQTPVSSNQHQGSRNG